MTDLYSSLYAADYSRPPRPPEAAGGLFESLSPGLVAPPAPRTLADTGLSAIFLAEQALKQFYLQGPSLGLEIARLLRLPFSVLEEVLSFLKADRCLEVTAGETLGSPSWRFHLTEQGRLRAREAFEQCRYVGPAPVPLEQYGELCRAQQIRHIDCQLATLRQAFSHLTVRPFLLEELGPAICSGRSIFLYGPPGNGKTQIGRGIGNFLNLWGGEIYVPHAFCVDGAIVTVFDPVVHQATDQAPPLSSRLSEDELRLDLRWRRIRRPVVIAGGELTLEMLDLRHHAGSNYYTAPLHLKANGGVFLIDDFGRQLVSPRDLLNRWIFPLEERLDYLTLATGKKFAVPFEQLILFATNLNPAELVDEAFLRRIRHKIRIGPPSRDLFAEIFQTCCRRLQVPYEQAVVDFLFTNFYDQGKPPRSSDPRDLLEIAESICRFRNQEFRLTPELMAEATERFFCQLTQ